MEIKYGIHNNYIDVTQICYSKLLKDNIISIPLCDHYRANYFSDPLVGVLKSVFIIYNNIITEYKDDCKVQINILDYTIDTTSISKIHSKIQLKHGNLYEELPEQIMAINYLQGHEKVLEIGSNIGRNTLVISNIIKDPTQLVTLESDKDIAKQLLENKELNNINFHIENSALSKRKLIQRGWETITSDVLLDGYKEVNTITLEELNKKYNIKFDTLVLDCEGAFYYILMDMPEILDNINLIIMENDYFEITKKEYVDNILLKNNFKVEYSERGGWGPCENIFFQVWKRYTA